MSSTGIKNMGDEFETFICETTSAKSYGKDDPRGDAYYVHKGKTWNIEAKDNAQNQVRADKNALLIGRDKKTKMIYGAGNLTLLRTIVRGGIGS